LNTQNLNMELRLFYSMWGHQGPVSAAIASAEGYGFDGIEGQPPGAESVRHEMLKRLNSANLGFIAEITTGGSYVPEREASVETHLESLKTRAEAAMEMTPLFLTVIGGCDAWSVTQSVGFFGAAMEIARQTGAVISFETHRSRSLFNPWITREILTQLPNMRLTCDFSHWCVVCERLVLETEPEVLALCAKRAHHVHARVGYDQGPQVPHPAAPEYRSALEAHERWWSAIWNSHALQERESSTMTLEFGPDGYLHTLPYTRAPVADIDNINRWIAHRQRERFAKRDPIFHFTAA
jgi:hypothetical protein